jgi:hypothetical protein
MRETPSCPMPSALAMWTSMKELRFRADERRVACCLRLRPQAQGDPPCVRRQVRGAHNGNAALAASCNVQGVASFLSGRVGVLSMQTALRQGNAARQRLRRLPISRPRLSLSGPRLTSINGNNLGATGGSQSDSVPAPSLDKEFGGPFGTQAGGSNALKTFL